MGQYYKPCVIAPNESGFLRPRAWVYSHSVKSRYKRADGTYFTSGSGLKLMEHSWMKNPFVHVVEKLLMPNGDWYMQPIVWAGDYADGEINTQYNWMDKAGKIHEGHASNLYDFCYDSNEVTKYPKGKVTKVHRYIVNHDTKQYVDKKHVPKGSDGWQIHPLPLLTCEGNGRGGGDYGNEGEHSIIGSWARCRISIETAVPDGYTELAFTLTE